MASSVSGTDQHSVTEARHRDRHPSEQTIVDRIPEVSGIQLQPPEARMTVKDARQIKSYSKT